MGLCVKKEGEPRRSKMKTKTIKNKNKTKFKSSIILVVCTIAIILFALIGAKGIIIGSWRINPFTETINRGLDLQGGVSVLMELQEDEVSNADLQNTKAQLELRVNKVGVAETVVATEGDKRIRIDIPGAYNSSDIVKELSTSGELTFKSPKGDTLLTGKDVDKATVVTNPQTGAIEISLEMNEDGKTKFAEATQTYLNQKIAIYMDDQKLSEPTVDSVISDGKASISGSYTAESAKNLTGLINSGALPVTVKAVSVQTVGSQLGADALPNAMKAGAIGVTLVFLFMILYYRVPGVIASFALTLFICLVLLCFSEVGATLTLPGIAALMLTIGVAVDANVLIFARIREELKRGIAPKSALDKGFKNAMSSIVDSNVTTIIAALVLYSFGSGAVKGFAVTLLIGVIISLFTALTVTKLLMKHAVEVGLLNKLSHFRVKRG